MIRVMVVDDNAIVRMGLCEALALKPDLEAAGTAASSAEALEVFRTEQPDVVTMDYQLPDGNGIDCTRQILGEFPDARILILSAFSAEEDIWNAVQAGAKGYLTKAAGEVEEIVDAIHEVASGGSFFPAEIMLKLEHRRNQRELTLREKEALHLLVRGKTNKEIAHELGISIDSVKQHITNLRVKLDAADRTQAAVEAIRRGIIQLEE